MLVVAVVGCKNAGEVKVDQYETVPAPVVGHGVTLYLGDVEMGEHAEVRVTAPTGDVLAVGDLEVRDELPFVYEGNSYVVVAVSYEDHTISDLGVLRVERRAPKPRADLVTIEEGGAGPVPGRDDRITVGAIDFDRLVDLTVAFADGGDLRDQLAVGAATHFEHGNAEYSLTLVAVTFEPGGVDRAVVRFRPGR